MLEVDSIYGRLDRLAEFVKVAQAALGDGGAVTGVPQSAVGLLSCWLQKKTGRLVLMVSPDPENTYIDCSAWGNTNEVQLFPALDTMPFDRIAPSQEIVRRRIATLVELQQGSAKVVVTSPSALLLPTLSATHLQASLMRLATGEDVSRDQVITQLINGVYRREPAVVTAGEYAIRGGIVDVFPPGIAQPWRIEWDGNTVAEIRVFDVVTQTSIGQVSEIEIWPAKELMLDQQTLNDADQLLSALDLSNCRLDIRESWQRDRELLQAGGYQEGMDRFAPYLSKVGSGTLWEHLENPLVIYVGDKQSVWRRAERFYEEVVSVRDQEEARGELPKGSFPGVFTIEEAQKSLAGLVELALCREVPDGTSTVADINCQGTESFASKFENMTSKIKTELKNATTVFLLTRQVNRLVELAGENGLICKTLDNSDLGSAEIAPGEISVTEGEISAGISIPRADLTIYTDHELFGLIKRKGSLLARGARHAISTSARGKRQASTGDAATQAFVLPFKAGDLVAHRDHGIGKFIEMQRVEADDGINEYMVLEYAEKDKLFVPASHLDRVDRYIGGSDRTPVLSRLGSGDWERTKRRVKERTEAVARELLGLYSQRQMVTGHPTPPDGTWQQELEGSFPFQETPDQLMVLEEIKSDMESSKPMDRLVCGDVGFGKTELAIRAAFKAAIDGQQVAVLAPTTVLAQQHFTTFTDRLKPFPLTVRQMSRFCSEKEIQDTLTGLQSGSVDIVIGTHRLLQKDVKFHNLGLLIIDEEQRFGVMQKEQIKKLRVAVDILSLSATPIPRTLHMSLAGIRDLSVIQTPPEERQPIKTYVTAREESLVREVIYRELTRGGQTFYVHNRVQNIQQEAEKLRELIPEVKIAVAHGQMPENQLAEVMAQFTDGEFDVLVCTTIIESGLDISNVNTIVVNDAHRFGLAQLYQLRGRVGRANQRAYAYFLYPPGRNLTEKADKRLDVITDLQDLGAGFKLAMRDLEIRGAGNLLGEDQHGEIAAVGLELYNYMLGQSVSALQGKSIIESPAQITVNLPVAAYLPSSYVSDERLRLRCYRDLAACTNLAELGVKTKSLQDRFGPLPKAADDLVFSLEARLLAAAAGVLAIEHRQGVVTLQLPTDHDLDLEQVVRQFKSVMSRSATRIMISSVGESWRNTLLAALKELGRLRRTSQLAAVSR